MCLCGLLSQAVPEVKIRNNLPAIQMEESTPITMGDSGVLAPEEIKVISHLQPKFYALVNVREVSSV